MNLRLGRAGAKILAWLVLGSGCTGSGSLPGPKPPGLPPGSTIRPENAPARLLRFLEHHPEGYDLKEPGSTGDLLLGDLLYHSPRTLGTRAQELGLSCQSCHPNGSRNHDFFVPGISDRPGNVDLATSFFRAGADNRMSDAVRIPSLRGLRYRSPYGHDGRTASLSEFVQNVVVSEFGGDPLPHPKLAALTAYLQQLDFLPNRFMDQTGALTSLASDAARRGEAVFATPRPGLGGRSCASCHIPSTYFQDGNSHRHKTGKRSSPYSLDDAIRTPSLVNSFESAPYFHDGRFRTMAEVVRWYEAEFGLEWTPADRSALIDYLKTIGAGEPAKDDRPFARRILDRVAYIALLDQERFTRDPKTWRQALELVEEGLSSEPEAPSLAGRIHRTRRRVEALLEGSSLSKDWEAVQSEVRALREELPRLAADWAGASAPPR